MIVPQRHKGAKNIESRLVNGYRFFVFHISTFLFLIFFSCGPAHNNEAFKKLSTKEQYKFQKYIIQGKNLYKTNCASCHQEDGKGLKRLIPPLANSNYLKANQTECIKLIKNGTTTSITVNGIAYTPTMPAHPNLTNLEIAEIITYINNSWGNQFGLVDIKMVNVSLNKVN